MVDPEIRIGTATDDNARARHELVNEPTAVPHGDDPEAGRATGNDSEIGLDVVGVSVLCAHDPLPEPSSTPTCRAREPGPRISSAVMPSLPNRALRRAGMASLAAFGVVAGACLDFDRLQSGQAGGGTSDSGDARVVNVADVVDAPPTRFC